MDFSPIIVSEEKRVREEERVLEVNSSKVLDLSFPLTRTPRDYVVENDVSSSVSVSEKNVVEGGA